MSGKGVRVEMEVRDLFAGYTYRHLAMDKLRVVDRSDPSAVVPFAFVEMDQVEGLSPRDRIMFAADVPAFGRKIYDVYVKDSLPAADPVELMPQLPAFLKQADYAYALDVDRFPVEPHPSHGAEEPALGGAFIWSATSMTKVLRDAPIDRSSARAELCAARNESVAFQVVIDTSVDLPAMTVAASDLRGNGVTIPAAAFRLEQVKELYLSCPTVGPDGYIGAFGYVPYRGRAGYYPDPLLPYRTVDIAAGERRTVWVTLAVPNDASAGRYDGSITASASDGTRLSLPINLRVFDFSLPDIKTFQPSSAPAWESPWAAPWIAGRAEM